MGAPRIRGFRYVVAGMLFLATTINYADRLMLSVVSPHVRAELGMSEQDYGRRPLALHHRGEYLRCERVFDLAMIGKYAWVPFIFGDIGYILGGWFSGYLMRRGWPLASARRLVLLVAAAMMPISIMAPFVSQAWMAIGLTCVITFGHALWISNLLTLPTDLFPGPRVGTATGLSGMGGAVGGMLANLTTGYVVGAFSYKPIFVVAGLMHPLAALLVVVLLGRGFRESAAAAR